ncbi:MAG: zinc ribbon domain-containing protein [candidate division WOR-3 bacterium]|nr:MAG: zinc ribbon domain-containing protein [candidate division WOR-3 bacterium]
METKAIICQSCGMPMQKDEDFGTNTDGTKSGEYCHFCFKDGGFTDEGITMEQKIDKLVEIAVSQMQIPKEKARAMAEDIIPKLARWRQS